jgi:two-component system, NtrC family, response regulator AtoC
MRHIDCILRKVAGTDAAVLVWGESGVGKELVARALHRYSPRRDRPFVKVNCAALPIELLESEMFGHERGAFTGAHRAKPGKFELAHTGTILLDEIGEMPLPLQAKLLQVLQDQQFARLGSRGDIRVDVRVVATTNRDLESLVESGGFRADLYYRLNVVSIHVPPLRERREEIPALVDTFLARYAERYGRPLRSLGSETLRHFLGHPWPGNVRQLENMVKRVVALDTEAWVLEELMPRRADASAVAPRTLRPSAPAPLSMAALEAAIDSDGLKGIARRAARDAERLALEHVLNSVRWNRVEAARRLKVNYKTLLLKIRDLGLTDAKLRGA